MLTRVRLRGYTAPSELLTAIRGAYCIFPSENKAAHGCRSPPTVDWHQGRTRAHGLIWLWQYPFGALLHSEGRCTGANMQIWQFGVFLRWFLNN